MATAGFALLFAGLGSLAIVVMSSALSKWPPLPPNPRATQQMLEDAERSKMQMRTYVDPWMHRLGLAAAVAGAILLLIAAIN